MRVAIFTDNDFGKVNGVTTTLKAVLREQPADISARVYTAADVGVDRDDYLALRSFGIGIPFYRGQWLDRHVAELETRYPRVGFKRRVLSLMKDEARRVPGGRFALVRHFFPLLLKA